MLDALIVGAGPTGLTLAASLSAFHVRFRLVDRAPDRAHESRALAVQARTLEILQALNLGEALLARGNPSTHVVFPFGERATASACLGDFNAAGTRFPFILFVSQFITESLLSEHLSAAGAVVERNVELVDASQSEESVRCLLRRANSREEEVTARYLVGCDGAHSSVRKLFDVPFEGGAYLQDFMLGDVEVDGPLEPNALHSFPGRSAVAVFFPLGSPATWRVIAMSGGRNPRPHDGISDIPMTRVLSLAELETLVDGATGGGFTLHDPAWLTHFRLHHRQASRYRAGRVFLAGDAAHIHSPVGGQGMNTGIQDAWNLGWKLALVARGVAADGLLDSYHAERWPVGRTLLRSTDRVFSLFTRAMSPAPAAAWARRSIGRLVPGLLGSPRVRARIFRFVSQLGIRYRKSSVVREGHPRLSRGPTAGDRLPDERILLHGQDTYLQQELSGPRLHLLLCGPREVWNADQLSALQAACGGLLAVHHLQLHNEPGVLVDVRGAALTRLGLEKGGLQSAQYLVRPDGYIGFRCGGADLSELGRYLRGWFCR